MLKTESLLRSLIREVLSRSEEEELLKQRVSGPWLVGQWSPAGRNKWTAVDPDLGDVIVDFSSEVKEIKRGGRTSEGTQTIYACDASVKSSGTFIRVFTKKAADSETKTRDNVRKTMMTKFGIDPMEYLGSI